MIYYDFDYILSKKHNELLNNDIIKLISKLNKDTNTYKIHNNHKNNNGKNNENRINLELNKLTKTNTDIIYNTIKLYINNEYLIKYFLTSLINNSVVQHNIIINYVLLYKLFNEDNKNYNIFLINYCNEIIKKKIKEKTIGVYNLITHLYIENIINNNDLSNFINYIFNDYDDNEYDIILSSFYSFLNIDNLVLDNSMILKIKNKIELLSKNLKISRLRFLCLDILDIINSKYV